MAVNVLLSYAYHARTDLAGIRRDLVCGRLMIDSGAFTAHNTGRTITFEEYAEYLERWRGCWDHAVTLDVIGDPVATARTTRRLHARGLPVMPVFTVGGTMAEFEAMVRDVGYVCAGGLVGMPRPIQTRRVALLQRRALELGGGIHALGVSSMPILRAARPYSADASNIDSMFRFGRVAYFDGNLVQNVRVTDRARLARDIDHVRAHGIDLALLAREGRHPKEPHRSRLLQAMSVSYAVADEQLRRAPVPAPAGLGAGPHLYNSITTNAGAAAALDRLLHDPTHPAPAIWRRYGSTHTCTRRATPHVPS